MRACPLEVLPLLSLPLLLCSPFSSPRELQKTSTLSVARRRERAWQPRRGARRARAWFFSSFSATSLFFVSSSFFLRSLCRLSPPPFNRPPPPSTDTHSTQNTMSFAMTANFFYAVVVAGLLYNVFILYAGASAAKFALRK